MNPGANRFRKGVFLLPNALTTAALFAGFYSIISGINGHYSASAIAVVVAGVLDGLDGRVARLTNTQSDFGVQYDSLSDLISFGLAPALLAFNWSLSSLRDLGPMAGKLGWLAAFLYVACAALRLARFNTQVGVEDKSHFQGLATPAAAGTMVSTVWFFTSHGIHGETVSWVIWLETVFLALLMFSRVRYFSGKTWPMGDRIPMYVLFLIVLVFALLAIDPPTVMLVLALAYVISGLALTLFRRQQWKTRRVNRAAVRPLEAGDPVNASEKDSGKSKDGPGTP
ncbi:MAG: CDP-diacylglycerol--serine O-phosphatidyltransferase [Xanthomonadales bacterium]|nr:CDP-diacylglycerol--serine O-phosphatidyltransferase [Xanthomonadales bacterium]